MTERWSVHPRPWPGEALASRLERIAEIYDLPLDTLVRNNLGPAGFAEQLDRDRLDLDPPAELLAAVQERTGVPLAELRAMTLAGWAPWLADTLDPDTPEAFTTFVRQDSVLFTRRATTAGGDASVARLAARRPGPPRSSRLPELRRPSPRGGTGRVR